MKLAELADLKELQKLCESFTAFTNAVTAIIDLDGNIFTSTGWRDICTNFHRVNPHTALRCRESDTVLSEQINNGDTYKVYKCKNGLIDVAVPLIIGNQHVANFFTGQFFLKNRTRITLYARLKNSDLIKNPIWMHLTEYQSIPKNISLK